MNTATIAGVVSTLMFAASTLPMVVRAARTRDVSSYSRSHLAHDQRRQRRAHRLRRQPAARPGLAAALHVQLRVRVHVRRPPAVGAALERDGEGFKSLMGHELARTRRTARGP